MGNAVDQFVGAALIIVNVARAFATVDGPRSDALPVIAVGVVVASALVMLLRFTMFLKRPRVIGMLVLIFAQVVLVCDEYATQTLPWVVEPMVCVILTAVAGIVAHQIVSRIRANGGRGIDSLDEEYDRHSDDDLDDHDFE